MAYTKVGAYPGGLFGQRARADSLKSDPDGGYRAVGIKRHPVDTGLAMVAAGVAKRPAMIHYVVFILTRHFYHRMMPGARGHLLVRLQYLTFPYERAER